MSGFINYGVSRVLQEIPNEILQRAFGGNEWRDFGGQVSIDERIRREVIYGMVMPDCNIVGGESATVDVGDLPQRILPNGIQIEIPLARTRNRHISTLLSLETSIQNTEMAGQATGQWEVYLTGPNVIFTPNNPSAPYMWVRCILENDQNLANYNPRAMYLFGDIVVLAAKALIYTKLAINTTITAMTGGQVDGRLQSIIDGYADSRTMYSELITTRWKKVSILQDRKYHNRIIGLGVTR